MSLCLLVTGSFGYRLLVASRPRSVRFNLDSAGQALDAEEAFGVGLVVVEPPPSIVAIPSSYKLLGLRGRRPSGCPCTDSAHLAGHRLLGLADEGEQGVHLGVYQKP
jgi:hypothetical protein